MYIKILNSNDLVAVEGYLFNFKVHSLLQLAFAFTSSRIIALHRYELNVNNYKESKVIFQPQPSACTLKREEKPNPKYILKLGEEFIFGTGLFKIEKGSNSDNVNITEIDLLNERP